MSDLAETDPNAQASEHIREGTLSQARCPSRTVDLAAAPSPAPGTLAFCHQHTLTQTLILHVTEFTSTPSVISKHAEGNQLFLSFLMPELSVALSRKKESYLYKKKISFGERGRDSYLETNGATGLAFCKLQEKLGHYLRTRPAGEAGASKQGGYRPGCLSEGGCWS